jgi:hypothetical protein
VQHGWTPMLANMLGSIPGIAAAPASMPAAAIE